MCSTGARESANRLELAVHDVGIDQADRWMLKGLGKAAHDFEPGLQPQPDGALVAADHKIKLHGTETALPRAFERVRAHLTSYAAARRGRRSEEHTSELQSHSDLVCRLLLEKKKTKK